MHATSRIVFTTIRLMDILDRYRHINNFCPKPHHSPQLANARFFFLAVPPALRGTSCLFCLCPLYHKPNFAVFKASTICPLPK